MLNAVATLSPMTHLLIPFFIAAIITLLVIRSARTHGHFSADDDLSGPQKFHATAVPRIGGVGMYLGLLALALFAWQQGAADAKLGFLLLACGLPAFAAGLIEDLTKKVSPAKRLVATMLSAALAFWLLDAQINRIDIPGADWLVGTSVGALVATIFAATATTG